MTYSAKGFINLSYIGTVDGSAGSNRSKYAYITNDDAATVETSGYFNSESGRLKVGDQIDATLDLDGAVGRRDYVVTAIAAGVVTIGRENAAAAGGAGLTVIPFYVSLADIAGAQDVVTTYSPGFAFRIEGIDFAVSKPVTTAAKLATLTPKVSGVAVTGGALALTSANCTPAGKVVAGAAITAGNVGAADDTISISATAVTAFAEGAGTILLKVRNLDG